MYHTLMMCRQTYMYLVEGLEEGGGGAWNLGVPEAGFLATGDCGDTTHRRRER